MQSLLELNKFLKNFLLFQQICIAAGHVNENALYFNDVATHVPSSYAKFIGTKEGVYTRKEFHSHRTGLIQKHGRLFIVS